MAFLTTILEWIAGWILNYLLGKATTAAAEKIQEVARDKERGEINEANVKAYEEATTREGRIKSASDLLNRVRGVKEVPSGPSN